MNETTKLLRRNFSDDKIADLAVTTSAKAIYLINGVGAFNPGKRELAKKIRTIKVALTYLTAVQEIEEENLKKLG